MRNALFAAAAALATTSGAAHADFLFDTGEPDGAIGYGLFQFGAPINSFIAARVTFEHPFTISDFAVRLRIDEARGHQTGGLTLRLLRDADGLPGAVVRSVTNSINEPSDGWRPFLSLHWSGEPGSYWISLEPTYLGLHASMPSGVPNPLEAYATGNGQRWQTTDATFGFRIWGTVEQPRDPADWDEDGDVDVQDLLAYLGAFRTGTAAADFDGDDDADVQDLLAYLSAFRAS